MASTLAILLFVEFERIPVASIIELIEKKEGSRLWSEGSRSIFRFRSPTSAVIAGEFVLKALPGLGEERLRIIIDTCEVSFDGLIPSGPAVGLGWSLLSRANWNMVYFSESTRLTLRHSEHHFLSRPEEWLERGVGRVSLHRLVLNYSDSHMVSEEHGGALLGNLSPISPAPQGRRAMAGLLDFLLALFLLLSFRILSNAHLVFSVIGSRKVVEAEATHIKHGYISPTWLASSGAVVHMGTVSRLTFPFPFDTGNYKIRAVYTTDESYLPMRFRIGGRTFDCEGTNSHKKFSDEVLCNGEVWENYVSITHGEQFSLEMPSLKGVFPLIDYVLFIAPDDQLYPRTKGHNILRSEDFLRLIGVWEYDDIKYHLRDLFVLCPVIQLLLHVIFLSLVPWTPGALVSGIRIVSRTGPRVPGLVKALLRVFGYIVSIVPFIGVGLIWPLIVNNNENWADAISQTRVIASGDGRDEE